MSDFHRLKGKTQEGRDWRGSITVEKDGESLELTVRQLRSPEMEEVMRLVDRDELKELRELVPEEIRDEYQALQQQEELSEEDEARLAELQEEMQEATGGRTMFDVLSEETFEGIRRAAIYAVEPDREDLQREFRENAARIEEEYGIPVREPDDVYEAVKDDLEDMIRGSTDFLGFTIGVQALTATVEDEKN